MKAFTSVFGEPLKRYVTFRTGLGLKFEKQTAYLYAFDAYVAERGYDGPLTQTLALEFALGDGTGAHNEAAVRYLFVRHFSDFLATFQPDTPRLDPKALVGRRTSRTAYIFQEAELCQLLAEALRWSHSNPIIGITLQTIFGLAASTGLRIGEVVHLDREDVELERGILTIRKTKFAKDRLVPVHPSVRESLRRYVEARDRHFGAVTSLAFFLTLRQQRFARNTLEIYFWDLARRIGIRRPKGTGRGPTFHDLRHSFAVRRLLCWYREGRDVQALLPALATYMGHTHYTHTAHYLSAAPELLQLAAERALFHPPAEEQP